MWPSPLPLLLLVPLTRTPYSYYPCTSYPKGVQGYGQGLEGVSPYSYPYEKKRPYPLYPLYPLYRTLFTLFTKKKDPFLPLTRKKKESTLTLYSYPNPNSNSSPQLGVPFAPFYSPLFTSKLRYGKEGKGRLFLTLFTIPLTLTLTLTRTPYT